MEPLVQALERDRRYLQLLKKKSKKKTAGPCRQLRLACSLNYSVALVFPMRLPHRQAASDFFFFWNCSSKLPAVSIHSPSIPDAINDLDLDDIDLSDEPPAKVRSATSN
jgi:hypothetical protein